MAYSSMQTREYSACSSELSIFHATLFIIICKSDAANYKIRIILLCLIFVLNKELGIGTKLAILPNSRGSSHLYKMPGVLGLWSQRLPPCVSHYSSLYTQEACKGVKAAPYLAGVNIRRAVSSDVGDIASFSLHSSTAFHCQQISLRHGVTRYWAS